MNSGGDVKGAFKRILAGRMRWVGLSCIAAALTITLALLTYSSLLETSREGMGDLEMLVNLLEEEVKGMQGPPSPAPPILAANDVARARSLLAEARAFMSRGDRDMAWMKLRELMLLLRGSIHQARVNATHPCEPSLKDILLGKLRRAEHWMRIFTAIREKTTDNATRELLSSSIQRLKTMIDDAKHLIESGSYGEAEDKLNEAFDIISETLRSLTPAFPPPCSGGVRSPPPRFYHRSW